MGRLIYDSGKDAIDRNEVKFVFNTAHQFGSVK